ncbi:sigma-70 family RNA polymerase sigma factor [Paenibacillus barcinonensis]|uniref:sigma-70 family RNA polymerase sigma factor n=1 Tax=Paenibacillus barcinonensis TaxID=198119 RepID=UPI001C1175E6|nr:sigma-70 family RNA polymerase sigma factor [Paenibacillus barcinonensis]MBU5355088.1 sigma-70 family RNA polymerase sigma factor [Paenibacillus barcinonensis]
MNKFPKLIEKYKKNPILKDFMDDDKRKQLVINYINNPTSTNMVKLDECFRIFYLEKRFTSYILSLIRFASIDFDRKERKISKRSLLILDDQENSHFLEDHLFNNEEKVVHLEELFSDPILFEAIQQLTKKEKEVLVKAYIMELSDTQIAQQNNVSQQSVSKLRTKALKKIRNYFEQRKERCH